MAQSGCDSIHTVHLEIMEMVEGQSIQSICATDCESIYGAVVCADRQFSQTLVAQSGCDSIHTVHLEIMEMVEGQSIQSICATDCESIYGAVVCADRQFSQTLVAQSGCDSIHTVHLEIMEMVEGQSIQSICTTDCESIYGAVVCADRQFSQTLVAQSGCDSIHTVHLEFMEMVEGQSIQSICATECESIYGANICADQQFSQTLVAQSGCDSIHTVHLEFMEIVEGQSILEVCPANCIALYGSTACSEERLVQTFTARSGCDSMHTFYFSMIAPITTCLLYTSPSPRDRTRSRMPSSA